ncbi:MAG: S41 family peptidase [Planctomycetota bacterium]|nr:S41 family peptidase [Planctomycetota bacterium]
MRTKKYVAPFLLVVLVGFLLIQLPLAIADRTDGFDFVDTIIDVRSILKESFVRDPDDEKMQIAAIQAMIETLDDPHTVYIPPSRERDFNKDLRGTYVGIGSEINIIDDYLTIISPMDDSPSLESGVKAGDVVLEIEGISTYKKSSQECIDQLLGEPDTQVTIKVRHLDDVEEDITITRRAIVARTVKGLVRNGKSWHHCLDSETNIAYAKVTQFNMSTMQELNQTMLQLVAAGMKGFILDLRDNPGGSLPAAIDMADLFLKEGVIVSVRPRDETRGRSWSAHKVRTMPDFPMIVLVNGSSASGSEIVAGALKDNGRATIIGTRTFGKGSVQDVRRLDFNRGTLKYTNAYYYLPSGRNLHRKDGSELWGVDPDPGFVIKESDKAFVARVLARRPYEVIRDRDDTMPDCYDSAWIRENFKDEQLALATEVLSEFITTNQWRTLNEDDPAVAALDLEMTRLTRTKARLLEQLSRIEKGIAEHSQLAEAAGKEPLLPDDIDLMGGAITLRDKDGNVIGEFRIDDDNAAIAINNMRLTRQTLIDDRVLPEITIEEHQE